MASPTRAPSRDGDIFVKDDGEAVIFYLYDTLPAGQRRTLTGRIEQHGGVVHDVEEESDVIIPTPEQYAVCKLKYSHSKTQYVEQVEFISRCINRGSYNHERPVFQRMGGVAAAPSRTPFSNEDDRHLVEYLANRIPDKAMGGRTGNNVYKELVDMAIRGYDYDWAKRHTWQSWRNRYKTRQAHFDERIDNHLRDFPPHPDGKGEYVYRRVPRTPRTREVRAQRVRESDEEDENDTPAGNDTPAEEEEEFPDDLNEIIMETNTRRSSRRSKGGPGEVRETPTRSAGDSETPERARRAVRNRARTPEATIAGPSQPRTRQSEDERRFEPQIVEADQTLGSRLGLVTDQGPTSSQITLVGTQAATKKDHPSRSARVSNSSRVMPPPSTPPEQTRLARGSFPTSGLNTVDVSDMSPRAREPPRTSIVDERPQIPLFLSSPMTPMRSARKTTGKAPPDVLRKRAANAATTLAPGLSTRRVVSASSAPDPVKNVNPADKATASSPPSVFVLMPPASTPEGIDTFVGRMTRSRLRSVDPQQAGTARPSESDAQTKPKPRNTRKRSASVALDGETNTVVQSVRRSTRQRSRSVEPSAPVSTVQTRRRTRNQSRTASASIRQPLPELEHVPEELETEERVELEIDENANEPAQEDVVTLPETIQEDHEYEHSLEDVEDVLGLEARETQQRTNTSAGAMNVEVQDQVVEVDSENDQDTDDEISAAQLRRAELFRNANQLGNAHLPLAARARMPQQSEHQLRDSITPLTALPGSPSELSRVERRVSALTVSETPNTGTASHRARMPQTPSNHVSDSEAEFPMPGTKAREVMELQLEERLSEPYSPAEGTRAAKYQPRQTRRNGARAWNRM